jgi:glycosyltransferase involved in cell wall biosynthesis
MTMMQTLKSDTGTPAGWPKTSKPLVIALLGWARLAAQAAEGSGYNLAASELAAGLVLSGHKVHYLRSGMDYTLYPREPHIKSVETWRGVRCHSLFNSPNLSPASSNFRNMAREMNDPDTSEMIVKWLQGLGVQVVHAHSLEGYALDLVSKLEQAGIPVVVTPHNYWYVCPQVDLLHKERDICLDYEGGNRCVGCLEAPDPKTAISKRSTQQTVIRKLGPQAYGLLDRTYRTAKRVAGKTDSVSATKPPVYEDISDDPNAISPDPEAWRGFRVSEEDSGETNFGLWLRDEEQPPRLGKSTLDANERMLSGGDVHLKVLHPEYGQRRLAGIAALNAASLVTPPSLFMQQVYETMGMDPQRGHHLRLGLPHFDQINRKARRSPYYTRRPWNPETSGRPVRIAFFGTTRNNKGFRILAEAIPLLDKEVRQRCQFLMRAGGYDWHFRKMLSKYPEVSFVGGYDQVMLVASGGDYDVGVLSHVWFENSPLVLLEHLHAGKFVISSRLGGPPEWVVEPGQSDSHPLGNGLMVAGGDPQGLAEAIRRIAMGEIVLPSAQEVHELSTLVSYPAHVAEAEGLYAGLVTSQTGSDRRQETRAAESA